ncbi:LOW QUALITY PROTEIN: uridine 5'-monophosphate synthase, partial [Diaphorina citri]|uniref:orotate phosphoribosyltransferase n=1 Tax=Diaphorina citri TaxID=121845 RepID=A0A3Q0J886_DIACI
MSVSQEKLNHLCLQLFDIDALKFGDFVTKVGIKTPVYLDLRGIISYPKLMDYLSTIINDYLNINKISARTVCGVPYTALPIATAVSVKYNIPMLIRRKDVKTYGTKKLIEGVYEKGDKCIPMLIRRKDVKTYGTKKLIEGVYEKGDKCVIIEDVVTSGSSILETINDLKSVGIVVTDVLTIVDREQGGRANLKQLGYTLHSLFTLSSVMDILYKANKIKVDTVEDVKKYLCNNQVLPKCDNDVQ